MIIPELPGYLEAMGGAEHKGLIIALFTVTALLARPFSGKLADTIGRIPVIIFGAVVCILCSFIYPFVTTVAGILWLRLFHGFSTGFTPTGETAYLADIIPVERRGEGMGILGTANTIGMAGGAALGGTVGTYYGLNVVFFSSSLLALLSVLILAGLKETLPDKKKPSLKYLRVSFNDLFEPRVLVPCVVMVLGAYSYGAIITLAPDYSKVVGITNKGLLLSYFTVASLAVRFIAGKASDIYGRKPVSIAAVALMAIAMFMVATASGKGMLIVGVVLYGLAQGTMSPTLLAWAADLSNPEKKARGVSSLYICMEFGIGLGAFVSGLVFANKTENIVETFMICSVLAAVAVLFMFTERLSRKTVS